ncbi:hypothetical protein [Absidia glauca]|uniref:Uncharacterized protein n=1 Tax=Absidia glauca TaxID=4829 RepID=A0A168RNC0_ABSGL|nr:hypothetical protein [Absidia glauca]
MTFYTLFRTKRKLRRKVTQRASTTDLDTSGILAQPFLPMMSRAKSPCDILDFVGYPRTQLPNQSNPPPPPPSPIQHYHRLHLANETLPLTIRNKTPTSIIESVTPTVTAKDNEPTLIVHQSSSSTTEPPRDLAEFQMPTPKKAVPPTWRMLNADRTEKTLVEDKQYNEDDTKQAFLLLKQKADFELERQDWARKEEQQRQLEQEMLRMIQENQAKIDQLSSSYCAPEQLSCMFKPRHGQFDSPSPNDSHGNHSSDEAYNNDGTRDAANENRTYYSSNQTAGPNTPKDRFFNHPANQRSTYHQNKLLLAKPMNWDYYPPYYSDDDDDDDDDDYASGDDNFSIPRRKPFGTATTQHLPNLESSDDGDDEEESLDDGWMKRSGLQSQRNPSVVYYTSHWHPSPGYIHRHRHLLSYQQQMQSSLSSPATPYHFHQYHSISRHPSKTRPRNQLMRHYSYEDVPRNGFVPYLY